MRRYRLRHGNRWTTVTMHTTVCEYLALHFGTEPGSAAARKAIRAWMQDQVDRLDDPDRSRVSSWLLGRAIDVLVRSSLVEAYGAWIDKSLARCASIVRTEPSRAN